MMTHERMIAILTYLIQSQEIMIEEHTDTAYLPAAQAVLDDARTLLAELEAGTIIVTRMEAAT